MAVGLGGLVWLAHWHAGNPRRASLVALEHLDSCLRSGSSSALLEQIVLPVALSVRTPAEQAEFITKALRDELSPAGLALLKREGRFGPLTNLFPAEAQSWTAQAGVKLEDCVAFRLDRPNSPRAEVVLVRDPDSPLAPFRLLRVNNVREPGALPPGVKATKPVTTRTSPPP